VLISHVHRTVFVHIPKTAGQSIETVFLDELGLTWDQRDQVLMLPNDDARVGPPRLAHLTADEYVRHGHLSAERFASYFTFSLVRNPWDRALSMYKYQQRHDPTSTQTLSDFVIRRLATRMWRHRYWWVRPQTEYIYDDADRTLVDFVGRFERLDEAFATVSERVGLRTDRLPEVNVSSEPAGVAEVAEVPASLAERYDDRAAAAVASLYERDIALLGYELA
jgi:hypothetical protein